MNILKHYIPQNVVNSIWNDLTCLVVLALHRKNKVKYTLKQNLSLKRAICIHEGFKIFSNSYSPKKYSHTITIIIRPQTASTFFFYFLFWFMYFILGKFSPIFLYIKHSISIFNLYNQDLPEKKLYFDCAKKILLGSWGLGVSAFFFILFFYV